MRSVAQLAVLGQPGWRHPSPVPSGETVQTSGVRDHGQVWAGRSPRLGGGLSCLSQLLGPPSPLGLWPLHPKASGMASPHGLSDLLLHLIRMDDGGGAARSQAQPHLKFTHMAKPFLPCYPVGQTLGPGQGSSQVTAMVGPRLHSSAWIGRPAFLGLPARAEEAPVWGQGCGEIGCP